MICNGCFLWLAWFTHAAGIFVDTQAIAVVERRYGLIGLEGIGRHFAIGDVVTKDRIFDVAAEGVDAGAQFTRYVGEGFVGRSEQRKCLAVNVKER